MSRRRAGISPSLFPFLAVLICTLGTLILLLALVAQDAKEAAVAEFEKEKQNQIAASASPDVAAITAAQTRSDAPVQITAVAAARMIEQERFRVNELVSYRDQQTADLESKRDQITQIESHMRKIKEKLEALNTEVETAMASVDKPAADLQTDEQTLSLMQAEAEKLRADIRELESSERGGKPRVVIVPHRGPNGTQRRPVYVICDAEGLRVMPEGVRISKAQALAATESDSPLSNPLGSALRVARRYAVEQYGDQEPPYPLLIVRPNGIYMYRVASALMKDWDDQYGYELVPGEVDLAFPGGDQVLRKNMEVAVKEAVARNAAIASAMGGGRGRGRGRGDAGGDGFNDGSSESLTAASASAPEIGEATGAGHSQGDSSTVGSHNDGSRRPAQSLPTLSARELDRQAQSKGFSLARDQRFSAAGYVNRPGSFSNGYGSPETAHTQSDALNDFLEAKSRPDGGSSPGGYGSDHSQSWDGTGPGEAIAGNAGDKSFSGEPGGSGEGPNGRSNISGGDSPTGTSTHASTTMEQAPMAGPVDPSVSSVAAKNASRADAGGLTAAHAGAAASLQSEAASSSDESNRAAQSASTSSPMPQNQVRREGADWALPEAFRGMGGTEFIRPISMRCQHDRFELVERGRVVQTFLFGEDGIDHATIELATAIRNRVANWGATMRGGYWKPRLDVSVGPHAEPRFHEFEKLMQNSGVAIARRTP